jgi:type II secretory pathway pseudopilin PulG
MNAAPTQTSGGTFATARRSRDALPCGRRRIGGGAVRRGAGPSSSRRAGLSLAEVMISLGIAAMLLTASAAAFHASSAVVQSNDEFARATQAARVSLHQILTQVRRGSVQLASGSTWIRLTTFPEPGQVAGKDVTYRYLPATGQLVLVTNYSSTDPDYVLASNVQEMVFSIEPGTDYTNAPCVANVTVMIRVRVGDNEVLLSGAAAPRRNLQYGLRAGT